MVEKIDDFGFIGDLPISNRKSDEEKLRELDTIIIPLIDGLISTAPNPIKWPDRKESLTELRKKIRNLTGC